MQLANKFELQVERERNQMRTLVASALSSHVLTHGSHEIRERVDTSSRNVGILLTGNLFYSSKLIRKIKGLEETKGLKPVHLYWLRYAYLHGGCSDWQSIEGFCKSIWPEFQKEFLSGCRSSSVEKCKGLPLLAMQNYEYSIRLGELRDRPGKIRRLLDISEGNWSRDWRKRWVGLLDMVEQIDQEAIDILLESVGLPARCA